MGRKILLKSGADAEELATRLGLSDRTVRDALKGDNSTKNKRKVRYTAIRELDGYYSAEIKSEGVVTVRDGHIITHFFYGKEAKGQKSQEYSLRINTKTGEVREYIDDKLETSHSKIKTSALQAIIKRICAKIGIDYTSYFGTPKI